MIAYLKGELTVKAPTFVILETNGVGYHVNISLNTYSKIQTLTACKIFTHLHINEDAHTLYGFADETERHTFQMLISISGVGPSTARMVLSSMPPEDVQSAIANEQAIVLEKIKGIGPKTARRIILELKDKVSKPTDSKSSTFGFGNASFSAPRQEALAALLALGFTKVQADNGLQKTLKANPDLQSTEDLIKSALKMM